MAKQFWKVRSGIEFVGTTTDPSDPANGDVYYNTTSNLYRIYLNGGWYNMVADTLAQTLTNKTLGSGTIIQTFALFEDTTDATKKLQISTSGSTTGTQLTLSTQQSTSQQLLVPNITATDTLATLGLAQTFSKANTFSAAGAASTPEISGTGTWFSGGSASTTTPQWLIQPTGTTSNNWNTSGTGFGINAASAFAGNLIDCQVSAVDKFKVDSAGDIFFTGYQQFTQISTPTNPPSGSNDLYFKSDGNLYQLSSGGTETKITGSSSSGSGTGDDINNLQYELSATEPLSSTPGTTASTIDTSQTTGTYTAPNTSTNIPGYYTLSYDASKTVTGTGTAMTLSGTPGYTVAVGDTLRVGTQARKITVVTTQTSYTIEAAFTTNPSGAAATVSQTVYSLDLNGSAFDGVAASTQFTTSLSEALVTYNDTASGTLYNYTDPARGAFIISADGTNYSSVTVREANLASEQFATSTPTSGAKMLARFFSNASSGTGTFNLVGYKIYFQPNSQTESGGILNQAYCFTNSVGTPVNCSNPTLVNSKTQVALTFSYPVGVNSGAQNGSILVYLNGQKIPRFINSTLTPDASYTETSGSVVTLDRDYSSLNYSLEIYQSVAVVDSNTTNTTNITNLQTSQLRNSLINGNFDFWQRGTTVTVANAASTYLADRWYVKNSLGTNGVITFSQNTPGLTNSKFGAKVQISTAPTAAQTNGTELYQTLENEDSLQYLNNTASLSVQIKALGNVATVGLQFFYATSEVKVTTALGSEQSVSVNTTSFTLGQLVAQSIGTLPTTSGVIGVRIRILTVSTGNTYDLNNGFIVEQAMANQGSACLTYFQRAGATIAQELTTCQRYYEKSYDIATAPGTATQAAGLWSPLVPSNTVVNGQPYGTIPIRVTKRGDPSVTIYGYSGTINTVSNQAGTDLAANSGTASNLGQTGFLVFNNSGGSLTTTANTVQFHWVANADI